MVPVELKEKKLIHQDVIDPEMCSILMEKSNSVQKRMSENLNSCHSFVLIRIITLEE